jgi:hypothetical protein
MRKALYIFCCFAILISTTNSSYAGFVVKKSMLTVDSSATIASSATSSFRPNADQSLLYRTISRYSSPEIANKLSPRTSGWEGIVAFVCGVIGFVGWPVTILMSILAIIFGAIGMGRRKRNRGLAIAGLVLGIIGVVVGILALVLIISLLSWL